MRRVKKEKRNKVLIFSVIILLLVCAGIAIASLHKVNNILLENSSEATIEIIGNSSTTEPAQELRGTVKDATMNTLTVQGEDNREYYFGTEGVNISTGETGIVIGNPVTVSYHGKLDLNASVQEVELLSITVTDSSLNTENPEPTTGETEPSPPSASVTQKAQEILNAMTLEEKVGAYTGIYYKNLGYYTDYLDILNNPKRNGSTNLMAGDLKYYDFNGDGKIDGDDQYRMGNGTSPRANFGINVDMSYKGWSFNMLWQGATNYNIYVDAILMGGNSNYLPVIYDFQTDIWSPDNRNALYPRQHASAGFNGNNNFVGTDFWLVDARYIRLKNMSIGYDFKHKLLKKVTWMTKCNLSLAGYNLLTFSPAKKWGFDPESGSSGSGYTYPISRVYTVSLNIGF